MLKINNLEIKLNDSVVANKWKELHTSLNIAPDELLDDAEISQETFTAQIKKANSLFGFDWPVNPATQEDYNKMHKDIETAPKDKADIIQSIHHKLHVRESGGNRPSQIQIAWTKSLGQFYRKKAIFKEMPADAEPFAKQIKFGEVFLGYPHVGKSPESCMLHEDNRQLEQTCRLHNRIGTDIIIRIAPGTHYCNTDKKLEQWYDKNKIDMFSKEDMLKYNGWSVIGEVVNKDELQRYELTSTINFHSEFSK